MCKDGALCLTLHVLTGGASAQGLALRSRGGVSFATSLPECFNIGALSAQPLGGSPLFVIYWGAGSSHAVPDRVGPGAGAPPPP